MNALNHIVESTLIKHTAFDESLRRIEQCFAHAEGASEPICLALVGESRTGKSRVLEEVENNHPRVRIQDGWNVPVMSVKTPSKPTVKGLAELMLCAIGDPMYLSGTENAKTMRLKKLMQAAGTRMVMIDEFQHFYDKGLQKVMHHVADWLKILVDETRVALVVSGLPSCRAVIDQNEQLKGRFLAPSNMPRFRWENRVDRAEFLGILQTFQDEIAAYFDLPDLSDEEMAFRCYCGTGGLIGYLTKFLRQAVWDALEMKKRTIKLADLERAHINAVWSADGIAGVANPFSRLFNAQPTAEMLSVALQIGTHVDAPLSAKQSRRHKQTESVRDVLSRR